MRKFLPIPKVKGTISFWVAEVAPGSYLGPLDDVTESVLLARRWDTPEDLTEELSGHELWDGVIAQVRVQETICRYHPRKYLQQGDRVYYRTMRRFGVIVKAGMRRQSGWIIRFSDTNTLERVHPDELQKA